MNGMETKTHPHHPSIPMVAFPVADGLRTVPTVRDRGMCIVRSGRWQKGCAQESSAFIRGQCGEKREGGGGGRPRKRGRTGRERGGCWCVPSAPRHLRTWYGNSLRPHEYQQPLVQLVRWYGSVAGCGLWVLFVPRNKGWIIRTACGRCAWVARENWNEHTVLALTNFTYNSSVVCVRQQEQDGGAEGAHRIV
jgi:hypothetical protein